MKILINQIMYDNFLAQRKLRWTVALFILEFLNFRKLYLLNQEWYGEYPFNVPTYNG